MTANDLRRLIESASVPNDIQPIPRLMLDMWCSHLSMLSERLSRDELMATVALLGLTLKNEVEEDDQIFVSTRRRPWPGKQVAAD